MYDKVRLPAWVQDSRDIAVVYHANCNDGAMAAWVLWRLYGLSTEQFQPGYYNKEPDWAQLGGRDVFIVDFSFPRPIMDRVIGVAKSVTILDHHESAAKALQGIFDVPNVYGEFDMTRAGCLLTWNFVWKMHGYTEVAQVPPLLLQAVADRDIWAFKIPATKLAHAWLQLTPQEIIPYNEAVNQYEDDTDQCNYAGSLLMQLEARYVDHVIDSSLRKLRIGKWTVPVINGPYFLMSDALNRLAKDAPFAAGYVDGPHGRGWSLRSTPTFAGWQRVNDVAALFGGGGHPNSAGFKSEYSQLNFQGEPSELPAEASDGAGVAGAV